MNAFVGAKIAVLMQRGGGRLRGDSLLYSRLRLQCCTR
jgi:hypothetical protein